jgi:DNA-binding MarR family transcriptional regulator
VQKHQVDLVERLVVGSVALTERAIAAAGTNLTFVQWRVLLIVGEHPEGATVGEIATRIGARGSPASRLISRLKERGVVFAERDAADRRVAHIRLSDSGRELRSRVLDHRRRDLESLARGLSLTAADDETIRRLAQALDVFT